MTVLKPNQFIRVQHYGVLATHSKSQPGYPFGSITPYIISPKGELAIFISHLAEHTHNIEANNKVALTIFDTANNNNPSAGYRITCLAQAVITLDDDKLRKIYSETFPNSAMILDLSGFQFYTLKLTKVRLVAGFGKVQWLTPEQLSL